MMQSILNIEINHRLFPGREINLETAEQIIKEIVTALGIEADIRVKSINGNNDFIRINNIVCSYPDSFEKEVNDYLQNAYNAINEKGCAHLLSEFIRNIIW